MLHELLKSGVPELDSWDQRRSPASLCQAGGTLGVPGAPVTWGSASTLAESAKVQLCAFIALGFITAVFTNRQGELDPPGFTDGGESSDGEKMRHGGQTVVFRFNRCPAWSGRRRQKASGPEVGWLHLEVEFWKEARSGFRQRSWRGTARTT